MKRLLVVWSMCISLLLLGSGAIADEYTVIPEQKGDVVQRDGYNVTDEYIKGCRELQVEVGEYRERIEEEPKKDAKNFKDGVFWGILGTLGSAALVLLL